MKIVLDLCRAHLYRSQVNVQPQLRRQSFGIVLAVVVILPQQPLLLLAAVGAFFRGSLAHKLAHEVPIVSDIFLVKERERGCKWKKSWWEEAKEKKKREGKEKNRKRLIRYTTLIRRIEEYKGEKERG